MFRFSTLAVVSNAASMFRECMNTTDAIGRRADLPPSFTAYGQGLDWIPFEIDSSMRVTSIFACEGNQKLKGFRLTISDPNNPDSESIVLPDMGKDLTNWESRSSWDCYTVEINTPIFQISADTDRDDLVTAISFTSSDTSLTVGEIESSDAMSWEFSRLNPVVAAYGRLDRDNKLKQLGWIVLNSDCQEHMENTAWLAENGPTFNDWITCYEQSWNSAEECGDYQNTYYNCYDLNSCTGVASPFWHDCRWNNENCDYADLWYEDWLTCYEEILLEERAEDREE